MPSGELSKGLRRLVGEEGVSEVVVGVPKTLGGEVGFQARKVLNTLDALRSEFPHVRFVEWDERFTTRIAVAGSRGMRDGKKKRGNIRVDDLAAARLLQEYLETRGEG
jgi:putative Holliday junction resolvase